MVEDADVRPDGPWHGIVGTVGSSPTRLPTRGRALGVDEELRQQLLEQVGHKDKVTSGGAALSVHSVSVTMHSKIILKEGRVARPSLRCVCSQ